MTFFLDGLHVFQYIIRPDLQMLQPAKMNAFCLSKAVKKVLKSKGSSTMTKCSSQKGMD